MPFPHLSQTLYSGQPIISHPFFPRHASLCQWLHLPHPCILLEPCSGHAQDEGSIFLIVGSKMVATSLSYLLIRIPISLGLSLTLRCHTGSCSNSPAAPLVGSRQRGLILSYTWGIPTRSLCPHRISDALLFFHSLPLWRIFRETRVSSPMAQQDTVNPLLCFAPQGRTLPSESTATIPQPAGTVKSSSPKDCACGFCNRLRVRQGS